MKIDWPFIACVVLFASMMGLILLSFVCVLEVLNLI